MTKTSPDFSFNKEFIAKIDSTNAEISRRFAKEFLDEGFLLKSDFQTGGKGQGRNKWESEAGKNLLFSFVLQPYFLAIEQQFYLSQIVSLALIDTIKIYLPKHKLQIKWPNDIYIDHKKIAGILIENAIQANQFEWVIIGIGLNVNQELFLSDAPNPVSIKNIIGQDVELQKVLDEFELHFAKRYQQLQNGELESLRNAYLALLYQRNEWKEYKNAEGVFHGKIVGIDGFGFLRMQTKEGEKSFDVKEIEYLHR